MKMPTLYNGVAGVMVHEKGLQSVSDNLANVNTVGYKATRPNFDDMLYSQLGLGTESNAGNPGMHQLGNGAMVSMQNMMIQGNLEDTDNVTDLAVSGRGFFAVRDPNREEMLYTRFGAFVLDKDGYMVLPTGHRLQGFDVNPDTGEVSGAALVDLNIPVMNGSEAVPTSEMDLIINLNADESTDFTQETNIDPAKASTYNYANGFEVYDSQGSPHQIVVYYQKLSDYTGAEPDGSVSVWKAATYERVNGTMTANPPDDASGEAQNVFYMHFDTNGHLVGTSGSGTPSGEARTVTGAVVSSGASEVSNRAGETFSYTGDGDSQTFYSTQRIALNGAWGGVDVLTLNVGGSPVVPPYSAAVYADGAALAAAINHDSPTSGVWASYSSSNDAITLYADGSNVVEVTSSDNAVTISGNTLNDVSNAIDNGRTATGAIHVASPLDGGEEITINATTLTMNAGDDAAAVAAAINNDAALASQVTASVVGDSVFIRSDSNDSASNSWALTAANDPDGDLTTSGSTLAGGMDGTTVTHVDGSVGPYSDPGPPAVSGSALSLARDDVGAAATVTVAGGSLGNNLATPLNFGQTEQTQAAGGGPSTSSEGGQVDQTYTWTDSEGATTTQNITLNYDPSSTEDNYTGTTQQAGDNEVTFMDQDGAPGGSLVGVEINDAGTIWASYSDNQRLALGAVALTGFISPGELSREGDNLWRATAQAGDPVTGSPLDDNNLGKLVSHALEMSTVDMANEMVNMINYQRAFQANSKSISTADEVLKTALNLKR